MLSCDGPPGNEDCVPPAPSDTPVRGYTFSQPFHLVVAYDWLALQGPVGPVFEGDTLVLRCQAWQDWPLAHVTFYRDGAALGPPDSARELTIPTAQLGDSGRYHCSGVFQSPGRPGTPETASAVAIVVRELFPEPTLRATPPEPAEGDSVTLSCQTTLSPLKSARHLLFSFYGPGGAERGPGNSPEFHVPQARAGTYWCEAATEDGHVRKRSARLGLRVRGPANVSAATEAEDFPGPKRSGGTPASKDPRASPPRGPDPHLHHRLGVLLQQMGDVKALLGHLLVELRELSARLGEPPAAPRTQKQ
ncbi:Fc receptor-like A [Sorex fumeus]|uniref:Fc receptor-like A n=1 Tax=Sorex fumeus TaxID=62283 RepID=UPI0024AE56B5|nr:Fc receptor-like A [Sorex fumeus]